MRLSKSTIQKIIEALAPFVNMYTVELRLYGSRVNDNLKGGDIDLLLLLDKSEAIATLSLRKHEMLARIKQHIGEQRIDLKITSKEEVTTDPFLQLIMPTSIILHKWETYDK